MRRELWRIAEIAVPHPTLEVAICLDPVVDRIILQMLSHQPGLRPEILKLALGAPSAVIPRRCEICRADRLFQSPGANTMLADGYLLALPELARLAFRAVSIE